eukprot:Colp12_sorted_trinity150504_noHs@16614
MGIIIPICKIKPEMTTRYYSECFHIFFYSYQNTLFTVKHHDQIVPIDGDAPEVLPTTLDLGHFSLPDGKNGLEAFSRDAGSFYCNQVYFNTLNIVRGKDIRCGPRGALLPVVFVHVPGNMTLEQLHALIVPLADRLVSN